MGFDCWWLHGCVGVVPCVQMWWSSARGFQMRSVMLGSYDELMVAEKFVSTTCRIPAQQVMPECQGPKRNISLSAGPPLLLSVTRLFLHHFPALVVHVMAGWGFHSWRKEWCLLATLTRHSKISALPQTTKDGRREIHAKCNVLPNAPLWYSTLVFVRIKLLYGATRRWSSLGSTWNCVSWVLYK